MMRRFVVMLALCACSRGSSPFVGGPPQVVPPDAGVVASPPPVPPDGGVAAAGPVLAGCPMFPAEDAWNTDISAVPADPHSADYLAFMGAATLFLHPNFGGSFGQPVTVVAGTQPRVPMSFLYSSQSEPGPYPFPLDVGIENGPDRHVTVLENGDCKLFETYNTFASGAGFHADSGAVFDLMTGAPRPDGWTSATAAGLPILPGLARYDEVVEQGEVRHALAFIAGATAHLYVAPATHSSGTSTAQFAPPMGLRVRLRADFDLSRFQGPSLVILRGLQKYGMFITDNASGQFWSVAGALDSRWPVADLEPLKTVPASAFEVVQLGTVHSGQ